MRSKIRYRDEPIGEPRVVADFLPSPAALVYKDDDVKVTLALSRRSVAFFKAEAKRANVPYQPMIRRLLDAYVDAWAAQASTRLAKGERTTSR